jgi:Ni/Fe-hydrogenase subunit HybB-like protein
VQLTAAVLYVIAVAFKRYSLMAMGFSITSLGQATTTFMPSPVEIGLAVGILSLGLLIVTAAVKVLPLTVPEEEHPREFAEDEEAAVVEPEAAQ